VSPSALQFFTADFFRTLAHPIRIHILELLGTGDRSVRELQQALDVEQPIVSQQLAVLRRKDIVRPHNHGPKVRYALTDRSILTLLSVARQVFNHHLIDAQTMLRELQKETRRKARTNA